MWRVFRLSKRWLATGLALCTALAVTVAIRAKTDGVQATAGWGLRFGDDGQPPVGNASADYLRQYHAYFTGNTAEKTLYLTFDAGYENGYTATILDVLKEQQVPATFFVGGHYLDSAPDLVVRMAAEGHIVANHTLSHPDMAAIADKAAFQRELTALEEKYETLVGEKMKRYYRPPRGSYSEANLKMACELGYHTFFWSLAYVDWNTDDQPSADYAFQKLLPRTHNGAIILLHSTSSTNAAILRELIIRWKSAGYTFGSLDDLV